MKVKMKPYNCKIEAWDVQNSSFKDLQGINRFDIMYLSGS